MKKFVILPLIAVATLGLAACGNDTKVDNTANATDLTLNSEEPIDVNAVDTLTTNELDNATVVDNATAPEATTNAH